MRDNQYHFRDVFFTDAEMGFVVGQDLSVDHKAVIFHTTDGGDSWTLQTFGNDETLSGVCFANSDEGWAVGGAGTEAIILHTGDGGNKWDYQDAGSTGALTKVCFVDNEFGWAVGYDGTIVHTEGTTDVDDPINIPEVEMQVNIYPIPFDRSLNIDFILDRSSDVLITMYNLQGELVKSARYLNSTGIQQINWNTEDLPEGVYFYVIQGGKEVASGKLIKQ
jgi:hypothetical protein